MNTKRAVCLFVLTAWEAAVSAAVFITEEEPTFDWPAQKASDLAVPQQTVDDFSLQTACDVGTVRFWGFYFHPWSPEPAVDAFTIRFYADNGSGAPALDCFKSYSSSEMTLQKQDTGLVPFVNCEALKFTAVLNTPVSLLADTTYYVSIVGSHSGEDDYAQWHWAGRDHGSDPSGAAWIRMVDENTWTASDGDALFQFSVAAVPEISGGAILYGMGLLGLVVWRLRAPRHSSMS